MDLGRNVQARQSGGRLPAVLLAIAVVVAAIAAVVFASRAGIVGGTATTPAADRSFDQIEAQRGAIALSADRSAALNSILDGAHSVPFVATMPNDLSVRRGYPIQAAVVTQPDNLSARRGYAVEVRPAATLPDNLSTRRGYAVETQTAAIALSADRSAYLNGIFDAAHAAPFAATMPDNLSARRGYAIGTLSAVTLPDNLSARRGYAVEVQPAVTLPDNLSARRGYGAVAATVSTNLWSWRGHAAGAATLTHDEKPMDGATARMFHLGR